MVLLLFLVAVVGIIAPVNAALNPYDLWADSDKPIKNKTKLYTAVTSDIGMNKKNYNSTNFVSKRKAELNKVNKVVVSVKGYTSITFKKPTKGWNTAKNSQYFLLAFTVKGNPKDKAYSVKIYNKNNKLIKSGNGKVHTHTHGH